MIANAGLSLLPIGGALMHVYSPGMGLGVAAFIMGTVHLRIGLQSRYH